MTDLDKDEQFYRDTQSMAFPRLDDREIAPHLFPVTVTESEL
jgi:hypothetical protein